MTKIIAIIMGMVACISAMIFFFGTQYTITEQERGILTRWDKFQEVVDPGLHFKLPFVQGVETWRTDISSLHPKEPINTYTIDNQEVDVEYAVFYRVPTEEIPWLFKNLHDYKDRLAVMANDTIKSAMGQYDVNNVASHRAEIRDKIKAVLVENAKALHLVVTDFKMPNLTYGATFRKGIEQAAVAKALVEQREQELQQARKVAERAVAEAKGEADSRVLKAQAEAQATKLQGEAQAEAIKAQASALASNAQLVEYEKAKRWDGKLPATMLSNVVPFMDVNKAMNNH